MSALTPSNRLADDIFALSSLLRPPQLKMDGGAVRGLPLDVWETEDAYTIVAEAPGLDAEKLEITFHGDVLTLKGARTCPDMKGEKRMGELTYGSFERTLRFRGVNSDQIVADAKNGVVTILVPKAEEAKPRRIEIKTVE